MATHHRAAVFAAVVWFIVAVALAADREPVSEVPIPNTGSRKSTTSGQSDEGLSTNQQTRWRLEFKRQYDEQGTPNETTKSIVRLEALPAGLISLVRLEVLFPDEESDFGGNAFAPRLGDTKLRVKRESLQVANVPLSPFVDAWFPTANPKSRGQGKYQVGPGIETSLPLTSISLWSSHHALTFEPLLQQVVSVAGDASFKDINYTRFEFGIRDIWREAYYLKLTIKPVLDWEQDGYSGGVAELEGGFNPYRGWKFGLLLGRRLWGPANIPTTYEDRLELTVGRTF